jgi:cysteinylglycine-S-conjugate dipeptidase
MTASISDVRMLVSKSFPQTIEDLKALVRIPSISWPSFDPIFLSNSAEAIVKLVDSTGLFGTVEILQSHTAEGDLGKPAIVARREPINGKPTVLLYAHHDVQPPGASEHWDTDPFVPTEVDGRLYGRGAADDKAGILSHISALRLLPELTNDLELGIVLFIEGEEEFGSPSFENFLHDHHKLLSSDVIIVADSGNWDTKTPALTTTLRGNATFQVSLRTLDHALHSGMFGGVVPDAFMCFSILIASLYDIDGSVAVEGLLSTSHKNPSFSQDRMRSESGVLDHVALIGKFDLLSRLWTQPSITVTGVDMPDVAHASNTLIPQLTARISVRVSPGQSSADAFDAVKKHMMNAVPHGAEILFSDVNLGESFSTDTAGWASQLMLSALNQSWGCTPVEMGVGGSIPFIASFVEAFPHAQVLVTGVEDPDSRAHSPNESLHISSFEKAIVAETLFLLECNSR